MPKRYICVEAMESIRWMLNLTGIWPREVTTTTHKLKYFMNHCLNICIIAILMTEVIVVSNSFTAMNVVLCTMLPFCTAYSKLVCITFFKNTFLAILEDIKMDVFNDYPDVEDNPLRTVLKVTKITSTSFRIVMAVVCLFYCLFPIFDNKDLPIPFSVDLGNYRMVMHVYQVIALYIGGWNVSCIDLMFVTIMGICGAQLDILCLRLQRFVEEARKKSRNSKEFDKNVDNLLRECVIHYDAIISLVGKVEQLFSFATFFQYFLGMPLVCNIVLQLTLLLDINSTEFLMTIILLTTILMQISMYSWFGNEVIVKSDKIIQSAYLSEWYLCSSRNRKTLFMIMERAKKPLAVTARGFTPVSLNALLAVCKWSYSIYALARTSIKT